MEIIPQSQRDGQSTPPTQSPQTETPDPWPFIYMVWYHMDDDRFRNYPRRYRLDILYALRVELLRAKLPKSWTVRWTEAMWFTSKSVGCAHEGHANRVIARLRENGVMPADSLDLTIIRREEPQSLAELIEQAIDADERSTAKAETNGHQPRPHRHCDDVYNMKRQLARAAQRSGDSLNESPTESPASRQSQKEESPDARQRVVATHATESPQSRRFDAGDSSRICERAPDSGVRSPDSDEKLYFSPESGSGSGGPPLTVREQLVAEGMDPQQATARLTEFGEPVWKGALFDLALLRRFGKNTPPEGRGAGWLVTHVVKKKPLSKWILSAWEAEKSEEAQTHLTMLGVIPGGSRDGGGLSSIGRPLDRVIERLDALEPTADFKPDFAAMHASIRAAGAKTRTG